MVGATTFFYGQFGETFAYFPQRSPNSEPQTHAWGVDFRVCDRMLNDEHSSKESKCTYINGFVGNLTELQRVGELLSIGVPREPEDFVARAVAAGHPRNLFAEDWSARDPFVLENLSPDVGRLLDKRNAFFKKWIKRAGELSSQERPS